MYWLHAPPTRLAHPIGNMDQATIPATATVTPGKWDTSILTTGHTIPIGAVSLAMEAITAITTTTPTMIPIEDRIQIIPKTENLPVH